MTLIRGRSNHRGGRLIFDDPFRVICSSLTKIPCFCTQRILVERELDERRLRQSIKHRLEIHPRRYFFSRCFELKLSREDEWSSCIFFKNHQINEDPISKIKSESKIYQTRQIWSKLHALCEWNFRGVVFFMDKAKFIQFSRKEGFYLLKFRCLFTWQDIPFHFAVIIPKSRQTSGFSIQPSA